MADTSPCVSWSIDGGDRGLIALYGSMSRLLQDVDRMVERLQLEEAFQQHFQTTTPRWFGLWIESPLTAQQCDLLTRLFVEFFTEKQQSQEDVQAILNAFEQGSNGAILNVELIPTSHVDLGWITTFVHCPRCKAEGPFERWKKSYPSKLINCPVCGQSYSPAATYHRERYYEFNVILCEGCSTTYPIARFSESERERFEEAWLVNELMIEHSWLVRVEAFYKCHPDSRGRFKPQVLRMLESDDPEIQRQLMEGLSFNEIPFPVEEKPSDWTAEDREVADFLEQNAFQLEGRMKFVRETLDRLSKERRPAVLCPDCGGTLHPKRHADPLA